MVPITISRITLPIFRRKWRLLQRARDSYMALLIATKTLWVASSVSALSICRKIGWFQRLLSHVSRQRVSAKLALNRSQKVGPAPASLEKSYPIMAQSSVSVQTNLIKTCRIGPDSSQNGSSRGVRCQGSALGATRACAPSRHGPHQGAKIQMWWLKCHQNRWKESNDAWKSTCKTKIVTQIPLKKNSNLIQFMQRSKMMVAGPWVKLNLLYQVVKSQANSRVWMSRW